MSLPIRVLLAKVGLDGHDRGVKVVARTLRDAGMDVIYTGLHRTPEEVVNAAVQEDVDILGVSLLSGAHMTICPKIMRLLKDRIPETPFVSLAAFFLTKMLIPLGTMGSKDLLYQNQPLKEFFAPLKNLFQDPVPGHQFQ